MKYKAKILVNSYDRLARYCESIRIKEIKMKVKRNRIFKYTAFKNLKLYLSHKK